MNDFKSYSDDKNRNTYTQNEPRREQSAANNTPPPEQLNSTVEMAKIITKAMNGKSTAQIMHTIIQEAERGKREGTLTNDDLDNFYAALAPILDGVKRRKLKEVITRLKNI